MPSKSWTESNQEYLVANIHRIKSMLKKHTGQTDGGAKITQGGEPLVWKEQAPPALDAACTLFGLSAFERYVLLLCAAVELDSEAASLCSTAQGNPTSPYPTFGLALSTLPEAHWSALSPASPLRRFRLVEVQGSPSLTLTTSPLRIEERILHYITGVSYLEARLNGVVMPANGTAPLVASHELLIQRILLSWKNNPQRLPPVQLWGADVSSKKSIAWNACSRVGLRLMQMPGELAPSKTDGLDAFVQLWTREAALLGSGLYVSAEDVETDAQGSIRRFIEQIPGPVFLGTRERWTLNDPHTLLLEVKKPERAEQRELWRTRLAVAPGKPDEGEISRITSQFDLNALSIQAAGEEASALTTDGVEPYEAVWNACRAVSRPKLSELAQQVTPIASLEDLILPEREKRLLREVAVHLAQRQTVYEDWGFQDKSSRGLGITTLFSGASGTGKTMAAEALANELRLDLFRIDIATVVSKYIGETEKNLRKVFDAAEEGGAILFFDEADALFGRRSEVRDSHDRYANIEISYLLQRMEDYRGLAILSTNMKNALDPAFARRIRFIVDFPFPDANGRKEIWRRVFPLNTPTESLDFGVLARLNIAGGNIRNIALYAAFLAADEGVAVNMTHLKRAAQVEYDKLERPLAQAELGDWQ